MACPFRIEFPGAFIISPAEGMTAKRFLRMSWIGRPFSKSFTGLRLTSLALSCLLPDGYPLLPAHRNTGKKIADHLELHFASISRNRRMSETMLRK
jgi:hypothetical protein